MKCSRCAAPLTLYAVGDRHCSTCKREVARLIDLDSRRRTRFAHAKDLTPTAA